MDKKKTIFFVSALVLIVGCYLLDLSYSLFVQTEEREIVESVVPSISSTLSIPTITLNPKEEVVIKQRINNTGAADFNYTLNTESNNVIVKLLDITENTVEGTIISNQFKDVYLYLKNESEESNLISFKLDTNYVTLYNNLTTNIDKEEKYVLNKTIMPYSLDENTLNYFILKDNITNENSVVPVTIEDLDILTKNTNIIKTPIFNDNLVNKLEDFSKIDNGLYKDIDNYGYSYYYRGNVTNNYVEVNNELWRIIRINGNGSIRLIKEEKIDTQKDYKVEDELEKWYLNNKESYDSYIIKDIYCIDELDNLNFVPSLICKSINENNVGLISASELLYTGLNNSYIDDNIYSLTKIDKEYVKLKKDIGLITEDKEEYYIKPVINIKNVKVLSGNGTKSTPYKLINDNNE